jgi:hypothetical protein
MGLYCNLWSQTLDQDLKKDRPMISHLKRNSYEYSNHHPDPGFTLTVARPFCHDIVYQRLEGVWSTFCLYVFADQYRWGNKSLLGLSTVRWRKEPRQAFRGENDQRDYLQYRPSSNTEPYVNGKARIGNETFLRTLEARPRLDKMIA